MDITINARHCTVPESLRNQAAQRLTRLDRIGAGITSATVIFEGAANSRRVEARLSVAGGPPVVSHGEDATLRGALDGALTRLERQLKRRRKRALDKRSRGPSRRLIDA